MAQKPITSINLQASYKKYPNRIELIWDAKNDNQTYKIYRKEQTKKSFDLLDIAGQNRFIDRMNLRTDLEYIYKVSVTESNGKESETSNEAIGALLNVATGLSSLEAPKEYIHKCIDVTVLDGKVTAEVFALKFIMKTNCYKHKTIKLSLFRSDDALLDEADNLLNQKSFNLPCTRGALTANNNGESLSGFLLLKIESKDAYFIKSWAIK